MVLVKRLGVATGFGTICLLGYAASAQQASQVDVIYPVMVEVAPPAEGPKSKNGGTNEQGVMTTVTKDGKEYLLHVGMAPDDENPYWQCFCSSYEMTAEGPKVVADHVRLTDYGQDTPPDGKTYHRNCNRPSLSSDGEHVVWNYSSDKNSPGRTKLYAGVLDNMCGRVIPDVQISYSDENDTGGSTMTYLGTENGVSRFTSNAFENGNGGIAWAYAIDLDTDPETGSLRLKRRVGLNAYNIDGNRYYTNIARYDTARIDFDHFVLCGPQGSKRPPQDGVTCTVIDADQGKVLSKVMVATSNPLEDLYYNQPWVREVGPNQYAVLYAESSGAGRKTNSKGSNKLHMTIYEIGTDYKFRELDRLDKFDIPNQTHAGFCVGEYGPDAQTHMAVLTAPPTGQGQGLVQMLRWSSAGGGFSIDNAQRWVVSEYADSGHESNNYGANPKNQGRDFLTCIGGVSNPSFEAGSFLPQSKTVFAVSMSGQRPDAATDKNSRFLTFYPGETNIEIDPAKQGPQEGGIETTKGTPGAGSDVSTVSDGCSYNGNGGSSTAGWMLVGLGLMVASRRRREEV